MHAADEITDTMNLNPFNILIVIALTFAVLSMIKPAWPLLSVSVLLVCVALLIGR
jgi:hypothetical protein